jgi:hypothetical protein
MSLLQAHTGFDLSRLIVSNGYDWRTGSLDPLLSDTYGQVHLRIRNLSLTRACMLNDYRAGLQFSQNRIPAEFRQLMQAIHLPRGFLQSFTSNTDMTPDFVRRLYATTRAQLLNTRQADVQPGESSPVHFE